MSQFELSILVDNKPITQYAHEGLAFVEGRAGSEYTIRLRNNSSGKACFIVSVDGLSILNGKEAGNDSPGYVLSPWQTLDVACYKVDEATGAKFVFGAKEKSYSAEIGKGTSNVGVIAAIVYREQYEPKPIRHYFHHHHYDDGGAVLRRMSSATKSIRSGGWQSSTGSPTGSGGWSSSSASSIASNSASGSLSNSCQYSATMDSLSVGSNEMGALEPVEQQLGTVFGDAMKWQTTTVAFKREPSPAASLVVYYDSRKNLERRGIKFEQKVPPLPNPFPANEGCTPPPDWRK
jgi:hypothetical protein